MKRFAIYARFSSDLQSDRSIEDQIRLCRSRIETMGGTIVETYADYAISGGHAANRPSLQKMMDDARAGHFDAIIAEALDRVSRDQEDIAGIYKRLSFLDVKFFTVEEGEVNELHIGLKGTMNALFLKTLATKTRRGQTGRVMAGAIPGGLTYGYRMIRDQFDARGEIIRGLREIDPEQAAVVRRIFGEYVSGLSGKEIAARLNNEGIPSPRGGTWMASTINGNKKRRNGILNNELYAGRIVYNRQRFIKDPETGKRQARSNPESEWTIKHVPELQIIDDNLWEKAQNTRSVYAGKQKGTARRTGKYPLSGLLHCGCCGGKYTIIGAERYGCTNNRERGTCDNKKTISARIVEKGVFDGLRRRLMQPDKIKKFISEFHKEQQKIRQEQSGQRAKIKKRIAELDRKINRIIDAIEEGLLDAPMKARFLEYKEEKTILLEEEARLGEEPEVIEFHPNLDKIYQKKIDDLEAMLSEDQIARSKAGTVLKALISHITLYPGEEHGEMDIEIKGRLAEFLAFMSPERRGNKGDSAEYGVRMVVYALHRNEHSK